MQTYFQTLFPLCGTTTILPNPLFVCELGASVGVCCWAVHSSTVFAAVTDDGKIRVWDAFFETKSHSLTHKSLFQKNLFDISQNKFGVLVTQVICQKTKNKLTSVEFNPKEPVLLVGDDRGYVTTLKSIPNLSSLVDVRDKTIIKMAQISVPKSNFEGGGVVFCAKVGICNL